MTNKKAEKRFIGLELPTALSEGIQELQKQLVDESTKLPIVPHITIIPPNVLHPFTNKELLAAAQKVSLNTLPFELKIGTVGSFARRVAFLNVRSPGLYALQKSLITELGIRRAADLHLEIRVYKPHITLLQSVNTTKPLSRQKISAIKKWAGTVHLPKVLTVSNIAIFSKTDNTSYVAESQIYLDK